MPGDVSKLRIGPGWLYIAPLGTAEPANGDLTTPWATVAAAWSPVGYTEEGHELTQSPGFEPIEVAEELEPVRYDKASGELTMEFSMAQIDSTNISYAFSGGSVVVTGSGSNTVHTYSPPALSDAPVELMIGWEAFDAKERLVLRRCVQTGDVNIARRKAPDKAMLPVSFECMKSTAGLVPFKWIIASPV